MSDKLWAPWRAPYITKILKVNKGCVFCRIIKENKDKKNHVIIRGKTCYAVLNIYPYNNGHLLVLPYRHVADLSLLNDEESREIWKLLIDVQGLLTKVLKPSGFNIGMNIGRMAGAGFPDHVHIHIVPRWSGDVNFMPVVSSTRIISQSLDAIYKALTDAHKKRN